MYGDWRVCMAFGEYCDGRLLMVIGECNGNEMSFYGIGSVCTVIGENVMVVLGFPW